MSTLDNALQALFQMAHKELLWQNASPTSNFPAQTITINEISDYDFLIVESYWSTATTNQTVSILHKNPYGATSRLEHLYNFNGANTMGVARRTVDILSAGIKIEQCLIKPMTSNGNPINDYANTWQIPYRIYGVKF